MQNKFGISKGDVEITDLLRSANVDISQEGIRVVQALVDYILAKFTKNELFVAINSDYFSLEREGVKAIERIFKILDWISDGKKLEDLINDGQ